MSPRQARGVRLLIGPTIALAFTVAVAGPAGAALPIRDAHYYGFGVHEFRAVDALVEVDAELRVSSSRRRFSHRRGGSYVKVGFDCKRDPQALVSGTIRLASRAHGVRIRSGGSFSLAGRQGKLRFRLRGRFASAGYARIVIRAIRPPPRRLRPGACRTGRTLVALYRDGEPPFNGCRAQRAQTMLRTSTGRIFRRYRLTFQGFLPHVYACSFQANKPVRLGQDYDDEGIDPARLAPSSFFVAYSSVGCGVSGCTEVLQVRDLRDGRLVHELRPTSDAGAGPNAVFDVEIKDNASVAWSATQRTWFSDAEPVREIWAVDATGRRMLDSGPGIGLRSLRLSGSLLTWSNGGTQRSATLD